MKQFFSIYKPVWFIIMMMLPTLGWAESNHVSHDLHWVFAQAWKRSGESKIIEAKRSAISAKRRLSEGLVPKPYEFGFGYLDDTLFDDQGKREYELSLELPVWKIGQRDARINRLNFEEKVLWSEMQVARSRIAGKVRLAYWSAAGADINVKLAKRRLKATEDIGADIEKRVRVGELAPADNLLAQETILAAESDYLEALQKLYEQQQLFETLVGVMPPKKWISEHLMTKELKKHPLLLNLIAMLQLAQAEVQLLRTVQGENSSIELSLSSERENTRSEDSRSFGIAFKMPLGESKQIDTEITQAAAELTEAERELMLTEREVKFEVLSAEKSLQTALGVQGLAERQHRISADRLKLVQAAFDIGEFSLRELLLSQVNADKALQNVELRRIDTANSTSRLNQQRGLLPVATIKE